MRHDSELSGSYCQGHAQLVGGWKKSKVERCAEQYG